MWVVFAFYVCPYVRMCVLLIRTVKLVFVTTSPKQYLVHCDHLIFDSGRTSNKVAHYLADLITKFLRIYVFCFCFNLFVSAIVTSLTF